MAEGSRGQRNASIGYLQLVPKTDYGGKQISSYDHKVRQGEQTSFYQTTSRTSDVDKQTGKYARYTRKEVVSAGETFKERSTGRVGYKDEHKTTSTYRVGGKSGYTEHQLEKRSTRVNYDGSSGNDKGNYSAESNENDGKATRSYDNDNKYEESDGDEEGCEDYSYSGDSDDYGYDESNYYSDSD